MKLGNKIKFFRDLKGYSQENMADLLKMSVTGYAKIERGESDINYSRLEQIAQALEVKVEDIVSFDEKYVFNNHSTAHNFGYQNHYYVQSFENERKAYLAQINQLTKDNDYLKNLVEKLTTK